MKKGLIVMALLALVVIYMKMGQATEPVQEGRQDVKASIVWEAETGTILYENNSKESLPIASMSKLMTQYLVLHAIEEGALSWDSKYQLSDEVVRKTSHPDIVKLGMAFDKAYTVEELFTAMTVISANDAAIALAELVSGSEAAFVDEMNRAAAEMGLRNVNFINATGLDEEGMNVASARDIAALASVLIETYPEVLDYTSMTDFTTSEGTRRWSTNLMLPGMPEAMPGMDGLKTGYTEEAGSCFASTGIFNGKRIITVVMGAGEDWDGTSASRFEVTKQLLGQYASN